MVANPGKFQIIFLGSSINSNSIIFIIENKHIKSNDELKLLGITIEHKITFTKHIKLRTNPFTKSTNTLSD